MVGQCAIGVAGLVRVGHWPGSGLHLLPVAIPIAISPGLDAHRHHRARDRTRRSSGYADVVDESRALEILQDRRLSGLPRLTGLALLLEEEEERAIASHDDPPLPPDQDATPAHLTDAIIMSQAHASRHIDRVLDDDVIGALPEELQAPIRFNAEHCQHHLAEAVDEALRLREALRDKPVDPKKFSAESDELAKLKQLPVSGDKPKQGENSAPDWFLPPRAA